MQFNYTSPFVLMHLDAASNDVIFWSFSPLCLNDHAGHCSGDGQGFCGRGEDHYHHLIMSERHGTRGGKTTMSYLKKLDGVALS